MSPDPPPGQPAPPKPPNPPKPGKPPGGPKGPGRFAGTVPASPDRARAVGKGLGLDYTRSSQDYKSCMSSAMRYTVGNPLDDGYVAQLW